MPDLLAALYPSRHVVACQDAWGDPLPMSRMPAHYQTQVSWHASEEAEVTRVVPCLAGVRGGHAQSAVAACTGDLRSVSDRQEGGTDRGSMCNTHTHERNTDNIFVDTYTLSHTLSHTSARQFSTDRIRQSMSFYAIFALERLASSATSAKSEGVAARVRPKLMRWMAGTKHGPNRALTKAAYIRLLADEVGAWRG